MRRETVTSSWGLWDYVTLAWMAGAFCLFVWWGVS